MKVFLSGYGKMGKLIEEMAKEKGWTVVGKADVTCPEVYETAPAADVCMDFSGVGALPHLPPTSAGRKRRCSAARPG